MLAGEDDAVGHVEAFGERLELLAARAVADDADRERDPAALEQGGRLEKGLVPLLGPESRHDPDDHLVLTETQQLPRLRSRQRCGEVDAVRDRLHALARRSVGDDRVGDHVGDAHDAPRGRADQVAVEQPPDAALVAEPDVLVRDERSIRSAGNEGPPGRPRELVRVEQVARPGEPHRARELARREAVPAVEHHGCDPVRAEVALERSRVARHQHDRLEARSVECARDVDRDALRPSGDQRIDEDRDARGAGHASHDRYEALRCQARRARRGPGYRSNAPRSGAPSRDRPSRSIDGV